MEPAFCLKGLGPIEFGNRWFFWAERGFESLEQCLTRKAFLAETGRKVAGAGLAGGKNFWLYPKWEMGPGPEPLDGVKVDRGKSV